MSKFKRRSANNLQQQLEQFSQKKNFGDENEWKLTTDAQGNGSAIIRFLPAKGDDDAPFVKIFNHGFKHNGKWFIENCPTTLGQDHSCPVCQANNELWNTEIEANKKLASQRKRKLSYWANVLVIKDEKNPENEGNVFKYRFGQKIFEKIQAAANPDPELGETPLDVTCVFEGANFLLKTKKVSGFANYDDSRFGKSAELAGGDEAELDKIWDEMHDLNKIVAADQFKSHEDIEKRFHKLIGKAAPAATASAAAQADDLDDDLLNSSPSLGTTSSTPSTEAATPSEDDLLGGASGDDAGMDELDDLLAGL